MINDCRFIVSRDDLDIDAKIVISDGLRIGRLPDSDVWLNHANVSRLHAGINEIEGYFYLINLSASSATTLNGRTIPFDECEALTEGDEIQIGPYFLRIEHIDTDNQTLSLRVDQQFAVNVGEREPAHKQELHSKQLADEKRISGPLMRSTGPLTSGERRRSGERGALSEITTALKVFWGKRTREKAGRPSPLHPRTPPRLGNARFNWTPTRDLVRPWPFAIFIWAIISVVTLSVVAAFTHRAAFAPAPISNSHNSSELKLIPAIAKGPTAGSCTSCHALGVSVTNRERMNANCETCHKTEAFVASITRPHRDAGLTCTSCHTEHRGQDFRPLIGALESCAKCHNDQNKNVYNGKTVHLAHNGTFGYPVRNGSWIWTGLDAEELAEKPAVEAFLKKNRVDAAQTQEWRNAQFHGIHLDHIQVVAGVDGTLDEDGSTRVLSCSSCHKTGYMGTNVDRDFPRTTCGKCHNAQVFSEPSTVARSEQTPSCTSCHVQHVKDTLWASAFRKKQASSVSR